MNYQDSSVRFDIAVDGILIRANFHGVSTVTGTDAFIREIEKQISVQGRGVIRILMDLRSLNSVPIRVHIKMSAWLIKVKSEISLVVVLGGGRAARTLAKGARMHNVYFSESEAEALQVWRVDSST